MTSNSAEALRQFTGVAVGGRALLIQGPPGCGKTSLALGLIDRGAVLVGDDGVALHAEKNAVWASPPSKTNGLIEIRNVGICQTPSASARLALVLQISEEAPRYIEKAATIVLLGHDIPAIQFHIGTTVDPIRAEYALNQHGLSF